MKQETKEIIRERFNRINKYLDKPGKRFHAGHIHSFRLEIKKLRSLFELISTGGNRINLPKRLKRAYKLLGRIRLIQLQQEFILERVGKSHVSLPAHYLMSLENEKRDLKKEAKSRIKKIESLKSKEFEKKIPGRISEETCRKYLDAQLNALNDLLTRQNPDDQSLHQARKVLKNLLYDLPFFKGKIKTGWECDHVQKKDLKLLEAKIGAFHDITLSVWLLEDALKDPDRVEERENLTHIRNQWQKDKEDLRKQIDLSGSFVTRDGFLKNNW